MESAIRETLISSLEAVIQGIREGNPFLESAGHKGLSEGFALFRQYVKNEGAILEISKERVTPEKILESLKQFRESTNPYKWVRDHKDYLSSLSRDTKAGATLLDETKDFHT
jgi:hypothetical protein